MLIWLIVRIIGSREREVELACVPELAKNGSSESGPSHGIEFLTNRNNCASTNRPCLKNWINANTSQWYANDKGNPVPRASDGKQYLDPSGQFHKDLLWVKSHFSHQ
jgi:hypothetical protein